MLLRPKIWSNHLFLLWTLLVHIGFSDPRPSWYDLELHDKTPCLVLIARLFRAKYHRQKYPISLIFSLSYPSSDLLIFSRSDASLKRGKGLQQMLGSQPWASPHEWSQSIVVPTLISRSLEAWGGPCLRHEGVRVRVMQSVSVSQSVSVFHERVRVPWARPRPPSVSIGSLTNLSKI